MERTYGNLFQTNYPGLRFFTFASAAAGAGACYFLTNTLPYLFSTIACALVIAFTTSASTRLAHPSLWWGSTGAIAGCILGTSFALGEAFSQLGYTSRELWRHTAVGSFAVGGFISGIFLGRNLSESVNVPPPKDFLKVVSGLTAGVFAIVVSVDFTWHGLEPARALASRLSTITTVLATTLALPGWVGFQLSRKIDERRRVKPKDAD